MGADARRVLIADADAALRQQLFSALLDHDIFSDCVGNTTDALEKIAAETYGVIVIDVALPQGDIERVVNQIATMSPADRPVVLVLAGNPEQARSLDVDIVQIVLRRPVHMQQLVDVVRSCIRSATMRPGLTSRRAADGDQLIS
jgi:DNA-binding response OmpR family regulator